MKYLLKIWMKIDEWTLKQSRQRIMFWPLIALGGRLVVRVVMNIWNMIE